MSGAIDKTLAILEYLARHPEGVPLAKLSTDLNQLRSGCHRTLHELIQRGYVRQGANRGEYALTTKLASMGLSFLSRTGVVDIAQPVIDRFAATTGELVRLAIVDGERLTLVAKAQGARAGLRYDPDMGIDLRLSCSAAGHAWLMTLPEDQAIAYVTRQGLGTPREFGPHAPTSLRKLVAFLDEHRRRGYSILQDVYAAGMSAMAAPVRRPGCPTTGVIVVAGPSQRLSLKAMKEAGPALLLAARELASASEASPLMKSARLGTWGNGPDPTSDVE